MGTDESLLNSMFNPSTLPGAIFYAILFVLLSLVLSFAVRHFLQRVIRGTKRPSVDKAAITFLSQLIQVTIFIVALILYFQIIPSLRNIGTAILATAGVASIVLGLAAQNTLGNIISGISILLYRPVRLGDKVKVYASAGDETGVVDSITLGYTTLIMPDDERIIVPNSVLTNTVIVNYGSRESD